MSDLCSEIEKFGKGIGNTSRYRIVEALFAGPKTGERAREKSEALAATRFAAFKSVESERYCVRRTKWPNHLLLAQCKVRNSFIEKFSKGN